MQLIEAALAFAITMLALSLVVSSFVEIIHRLFKMREAGLKYMLGQLFDQVLVKYLAPLAQKQLAENPALKGKTVQDALASLREGFVARMTANRAPVGLKPDPMLAAAPVQKPTDTVQPAQKVGDPVPAVQKTADPAPPAQQTPTATTSAQPPAKPGWQLGNIWGGRDVTKLTPNEFMERLGSLDIGQEIKNAASTAGGQAADAVEALLKDIAQKFEGFGNDAATYFEGRARFMSVIVAIALAFFAHVDAVDLFKTYLRDPNARAKVIEQAQAVTAQHKAAQDAAAALKGLDPTMGASTEDGKKQVEALKKDWETAINNANATVKQYSDMGVPIGWNEDRLKAADMSQWVWTCPGAAATDWPKLYGDCARDKRNVWFQVPTVLSVWFYLFLGGLLIGLGAPFWYNAVTGLTNIRNVARGVTGTDTRTQTTAAAATNEAQKAQPVTPVGAFQVANTGARP